MSVEKRLLNEVLIKLRTLGFGTNDEINGADAVDEISQLYQDVSRQLGVLQLNFDDWILSIEEQLGRQVIEEDLYRPYFNLGMTPKNCLDSIEANESLQRPKPSASC